MKNRYLFALLSLPATVLAQEQGKVISSTPMVLQHQVPTQVCRQIPVEVQQPTTGAGTVLGAIAGGALGSTIGHGAGNAAATMAGVVAGAIVGDKVEGQNTVVQTQTVCTSELTTQSVTSYQVVYEYGGRRHTVEMPADPGNFVKITNLPLPVLQAPPQIVSAGFPQPIGQPVYVVPYYGYSYPYPYIAFEYRLSHPHHLRRR